MNFNQYLSAHTGKYIDMDGVYGAQCWDSWCHYATSFLGVPYALTSTITGGAHEGWACNVYHHARQVGLTKYFDVLGAGATPRAGDVAFWEYGSRIYPWSHVAIVIRNGNGSVFCLTQNPTPNTQQWLSKSGLLGYLRPKKLNPAPKRKKDIVKHYHYEDKVARSGGRILAAGEHLYLNNTKGKPSNAKNIVGTVGTYDLKGHIYATGTPGDVLELTFCWQNVKAKKPTLSPNYTKRVTFDRDGLIQSDIQTTHAVTSGFAVYLRVRAAKTNKGTAKITVLDSDTIAFAS